MSSELERDIDNFIFFGGEFPNLVKGVREVPMPKGFYVCMECKKVSDHYEFGGVCEGCEAKAELYEKN